MFFVIAERAAALSENSNTALHRCVDLGDLREKIATSLPGFPQSLELVAKALGNSSNDVSSQLKGIPSTLTQSTRYASGANAIIKGKRATNHTKPKIAVRSVM